MNVDKLRVVNDKTVQWISDHWDNRERANVHAPQFAFLGIPFDYAVSHRPGSRFGPQSIIDVLKSYSLYWADKRVSLKDCVLADFGTVEIVHDIRESYQNIQQAVREIPREFIPVLLGGDHSITDPIFRGMVERLQNKQTGILMFDTHFDFREPTPGKEHSGHWLKTLEDVIDYRNVSIIGIGAPVYSERYMEELERRGAKVWTAYEVRKFGREHVLQEAVNHILKSADGIYITVDIDCVDQAFVPGCSVPNPNGLYPHEVMDSIFEICAQTPVVGMDINEVSPWYDHQQHFTPQIAAYILMNFLAGVTKRSLG